MKIKVLAKRGNYYQVQEYEMKDDATVDDLMGATDVNLTYTRSANSSEVLTDTTAQLNADSYYVAQASLYGVDLIAEGIIAGAQKFNFYKNDKGFSNAANKVKAGKVYLDQVQKNKAHITIKASDILPKDKQATQKIGEQTFSLSQESAKILGESGHMYLANELPQKFYLALTQIFKDNPEYLKGAQVISMALPEVKDPAIAQLVAAVNKNPTAYGFDSYSEWFKIKWLTLVELGAYTVFTQWAMPILGEDYQLSSVNPAKPVVICVSAAAGIDLQPISVTNEFHKRYVNYDQFISEPRAKVNEGLFKSYFTTLMETEIKALTAQGITHISMLPRGLGVFIQFFGEAQKKQIQNIYFDCLKTALQQHPELTVYLAVPSNMADVACPILSDVPTIYLHDRDAVSIAIRLAEQGHKVALQNPSDVKGLFCQQHMGMHWKEAAEEKSTTFVGEEDLYARTTLPDNIPDYWHNPQHVINIKDVPQPMSLKPEPVDLSDMETKYNTQNFLLAPIDISKQITEIEKYSAQQHENKPNLFSRFVHFMAELFSSAVNGLYHFVRWVLGDKKGDNKEEEKPLVDNRKEKEKINNEKINDENSSYKSDKLSGIKNRGKYIRKDENAIEKLDSSKLSSDQIEPRNYN